MRGVNSEELGAIVNFLYFGEANIFQQNLDSFLALAEELRLSGLTESGVLVDTKETPNKARRKKEEEKTKMIKIPADCDTVVAVQNNQLRDLDEQIKSMMTITGVRPANGKGFITSCNICGKEARAQHMPSHILVTHVERFSGRKTQCINISIIKHSFNSRP